jgi:hypothetical protein
MLNTPVVALVLAEIAAQRQQQGLMAQLYIAWMAVLGQRFLTQVQFNL